MTTSPGGAASVSSTAPTTTTTTTLTDEQVERYRNDGVVLIRSAVDPDTVHRMTEAVEEVMRTPSRFGGDMTGPDRPGMFFQDRHLFPRSETFRSFLDGNPLAAMARPSDGLGADPALL